MQPIPVPSQEEIANTPEARALVARLGEKSGRLARLWARLLSNGGVFDPLLMQGLRVERALTPKEQQTVVSLRVQKYREKAVAELEPEDLAANSELYVCYSASGDPLGAIRIRFALDAGQALTLDQVTEVPDCWRLRADGTKARLGEAMRLCVAGRSKQEQLCTKLALWRIAFIRSRELKVDWLLSVARPPLNSDYQLVSYESVQPEPHWVYPPDHPVAHELMALNVQSEVIACRRPGHWLNSAFYPNGNHG